MAETEHVPISGPDVKLVVVKKKPKDTGPGYSDQEVDALLNSPVMPPPKEADNG